MSPESIRIGIVGYGAAGRAMGPAVHAHDHFELVAVCDPSPEIQNEVAGNFGVRTYASLDQMLKEAALDAVYIATPTHLHAQHAHQCIEAGKHLLVEKPMAVDCAAAHAMVDAAERRGVAMVVGHSHGFDAPISAMHEVVRSGRLGRVRMVSTNCYTDWMYRPRRPEELDISLGGGVVYRQGAHQFDIVRLLCGGLTRRVRAREFDWDARRPGVGAYTAWLEFDNGAVATVNYNGYGNLLSDELCFGITEGGYEMAAMQPSYRARAALGEQNADVSSAKLKRAREVHGRAALPPYPPFFGLTVVSCEGGDIRQSPLGLYVYAEGSRSEIPVPNDRGSRMLVLDELAATIRSGEPSLHSGRWGLANLELCEAVIESSRSGSEPVLRYQVSLPHPA